MQRNASRVVTASAYSSSVVNPKVPESDSDVAALSPPRVRVRRASRPRNSSRGGWRKVLNSFPGSAAVRVSRRRRILPPLPNRCLKGAKCSVQPFGRTPYIDIQSPYLPKVSIARNLPRKGVESFATGDQKCSCGHCSTAMLSTSAAKMSDASNRFGSPIAANSSNSVQ